MTRPEGIWSDGTTMWVVEFSDADKAFAFSLTGKTRDAGRDIQLPSQRDIYDLWSDGTTVWLVNYSGGVVTNKLYAYTLPPVSAPTPTPTFTPSPTHTPTPTPTATPRRPNNNPVNRATSTPAPTPRPNSNVGPPPAPPGNNAGGPPIPRDDVDVGPPLLPATPTPTRTPTRTPTPTPTSTAAPAGGNDGSANSGAGPRVGLVAHDATPVQLFLVDSGLQAWFIGPNGASAAGPALSSVSALAAAHPAGASVSLYEGQHPFTNKSVRITYLPALRKLQVSTYYADNPPHQVDKLYVFTVDENNAVNHLNW